MTGIFHILVRNHDLQPKDRENHMLYEDFGDAKSEFVFEVNDARQHHNDEQFRR